MKVELTADVAEGGRDLAKARAAADAFGLGKSDPKYPRLKVTVSKRGRIEYVKGLVIDMNPDGAAKFVERGIGRIVETSEGETQSIAAADVGTVTT